MDKRIRNHPLALALLLLLGVFSWISAAGILLLAVSTLNGSLGGLLNSAGWLGTAIGAVVAGNQMLLFRRTMRHFEIRLYQDGVRFILGKETYISWQAITAVRRSRAGIDRTYTVATRSGQAVRFSSSMFLRAGHAAREIAQRAGCRITG